MAVNLEERDLKIGWVLSSAFATFGRNAPQFALLALVLAGAPVFLMHWIVPGMLADPEAAVFAPEWLVAWPVFLISSYVLQAAMIRSAILDMSGRPADFGGSAATAFRLILPLIGLAFLSYLIIGFGFMLLIVPGIFAYVLLSVAVPVLVAERRGVVGSMQRSRELTKGARWKVFGLVVIIALLYLLSAELAELLTAAFGMDPIEDKIAYGLVQGVLAAAVAALVATMTASLYVALRTAREGASGDRLAEIFA